ADDSWVAVEALLPRMVAEDDHWISAGAVLFREEAAPARQRYSQRRKQFGRDLAAGDVLGLAGCADRAAPGAPCCRRPERVALTPAIQKVEVGSRPFVAVLLSLFMHSDQAIGLGVRQRLQQDAVGHVEHDGRGPGAERQ